MNYSTPGVYVEEIALLPPSVAQVATAIPAFLGYTEKALDENGVEQAGTVVTRISNLKEYSDKFGDPLGNRFTVSTVNGNMSIIPKKSDGTTDLGLIPEFLMYYSLKIYFDNGGGACYIVSVGRYRDNVGVVTKSANDFTSGLEAIRKIDEPTLLILVDAVHLPDDYLSLCQNVLVQCGDLKDRFGIFDVLHGDTDASSFRNGIGMNELKYGAAYTPYLNTLINYAYKEEEVLVSGIKYHQTDENNNGLLVVHQGNDADSPQVMFAAGAEISFAITDSLLTISGFDVERTPAAIVESWSSFDEKGNFELFIKGDGSVNVTSSADAVDIDEAFTMDRLKNTLTQAYNQIKKGLAKQRVTLPPSAAMAGIYARVDRSRGVWKSPANESLNNILAPVVKIDNNQQGLLNIDPTAGKSINAIRAFAGKGILIWGGRTLAGNDNEWRYINVRRLFILIEESIQKATGFVVFESNDATTWLKVKALIESFLYSLWQQGALAGPTPESSYTVNVGLGKTMTQQDILEGKLIVEVGVAAVRPAEFIILKFYHKLQEA